MYFNADIGANQIAKATAIARVSFFNKNSRMIAGLVEVL